MHEDAREGYVGAEKVAAARRYLNTGPGVGLEDALEQVRSEEILLDLRAALSTLRWVAKRAGYTRADLEWHAVCGVTATEKLDECFELELITDGALHRVYVPDAEKGHDSRFGIEEGDNRVVYCLNLLDAVNRCTGEIVNVKPEVIRVDD